VVQIFRAADNNQFVILHCNSVYPAGPDIVHLPRMLDYQRHFNCHVGFSDHTETNTASVAAVAMGACVVERHFTLSRELDSPDAPLSLEPSEFAEFVNAVREAEKICAPSSRISLELEEQAFKNRIRHCLLSTHEIKAGEPLTDANASLMRGNAVLGVDAWDIFKNITPTAKTDIPALCWIQSDQVCNFSTP
jgi:sialic acid synthase SpsE